MHTVRIADPERLQAVLAHFVQEHGGQTKASIALDIDRSTFRNLLKGRVTDGMSYRTYSKLMTALGASPRPLSVPDPFLTEPWFLDPKKAEDRELTRDETLAMQKGLSRRTRGSEIERVKAADAAQQLYSKFLGSIVTGDEELGWAHYQGWVRMELERIAARAKPIVRALWDEKPYRRRFADFLEKVGRDRGDLPAAGDTRCWLALCRAVQPLSNAADSWGVELTWEELHESGDLKAYLKAALNREALLVKWKRELDWVKRAKVPRSYWEAMEVMAARDHFFEDNPSATEDDWEALLAEGVTDED